MEQTPVAGFHDLWTAHAGAVYRFALYLSSNIATAEDLTSEAFLRVWSAWDRVAWPTVRSYLFATVRNLHLQQSRHIRREAPLDFDIAITGSVADRAEHRDALERTWSAMRQLPEIDRAALLLRVEENMPYEEIAAALGIPVATAKVKVHRARLRLAEITQRSTVS